MIRDRFFIDNDGVKQEPFSKTFKYIDGENKNNAKYHKVFMVIMNNSFKRVLYELGLIENEDESEIEFANFSCEIINAMNLLKKGGLSNTLIISTWLDGELVFKIEELTGISAIIGIPWHERTLEIWNATFGPINMQNQKRLEYKDISNQELKSRFDSLTHKQINWTTLHPYDVITIKTLIKEFKHAVDPLEIFAYLRREKNLNYNRCVEIERWTDNLIKGKKVRIN